MLVLIHDTVIALEEYNVSRVASETSSKENASGTSSAGMVVILYVSDIHHIVSVAFVVSSTKGDEIFCTDITSPLFTVEAVVVYVLDPLTSYSHPEIEIDVLSFIHDTVILFEIYSVD